MLVPNYSRLLTLEQQERKAQQKCKGNTGPRPMCCLLLLKQCRRNCSLLRCVRRESALQPRCVKCTKSAMKLFPSAAGEDSQSQQQKEVEQEKWIELDKGAQEPLFLTLTQKNGRKEDSGDGEEKEEGEERKRLEVLRTVVEAMQSKHGVARSIEAVD